MFEAVVAVLQQLRAVRPGAGPLAFAPAVRLNE
jgi:hypothetical protein